MTVEVAGLLSLCTVRWSQGIQLYVVLLCRRLRGEPVPDGTENDRAEYLALADLEDSDRRVEPCCAALARMALTGSHRSLRPVDTSSWGAQYISAFC